MCYECFFLLVDYNALDGMMIVKLEMLVVFYIVADYIVVY